MRQLRPEDIELLEEYSKFLEENHYLDTDWWSEEPKAIDEFSKGRLALDTTWKNFWADERLLGRTMCEEKYNKPTLK